MTYVITLTAIMCSVRTFLVCAMLGWTSSKRLFSTPSRTGDCCAIFVVLLVWWIRKMALTFSQLVFHIDSNYPSRSKLATYFSWYQEARAGSNSSLRSTGRLAPTVPHQTRRRKCGCRRCCYSALHVRIRSRIFAIKCATFFRSGLQVDRERILPRLFEMHRPAEGQWDSHMHIISASLIA